MDRMGGSHGLPEIPVGAVTAPMEFQMRFLSAGVAMGSEWMRFLTHRFDRDVDWLRQVGAAKSPQEALAITTHFMNEAVREYGDEMFRLTETGEAAFSKGQPPQRGRKAS